ncbi:uncharacterized protein LOC122657984 [Telopea speciosissima]|uniref:uncharacterized protein LOC122657984 n=1 Tax=Telopea speciosissima TaxID=54955 RepID=UPI001CC38972|nr:uncharacterized protein LOC122657984 [Telopea speciosissima]
MGSLMHLFECSQPSMLWAHKRHVDGFEAPRNSLELPTEISQNICDLGSNILYSFQEKQNSSETNCYPKEHSMKKLIDGEISNGPETRRNTPSVVARLMGMDTLPSEPKLAIRVKEKRNEKTGKKPQREEQTKNVLIDSKSLESKHLKQREVKLASDHKTREFDRCSCVSKFEKPRPREHPQEEELQQFKREFEKWQAMMVWERARCVELGRIPSQYKEKMALYAGSRRSTEKEKPIELMHHNSLPTPEVNSQGSFALKHRGFKKEALQTNEMEPVNLRNRTQTGDLEEVPLMNCDPKLGKSAVPTKIVILKPSTDRNGSSEDSWAGSPESIQGVGSIEDFLEEVKERLRCEIQGKSVKREMAVRGGGIETPFREKLSDPKEIARNIAKQVRENVTKDLGATLLRSESTGSYRSEIQINESSSPEFINRDTRKLLSERLRNVLNRESNVDVLKMGYGSSRASVLDNEGKKLRPTRDVLKTENKASWLKNMKDEAEMQTKPFRHGQDNKKMLYAGEVSPRNLVRSLSAPVSGTSFGKLLLEDRHILTGAHIRRKHEAAENVPVEVRKLRKERFSLRGRVSSLKSSFTLRGKLFGRKIQSEEEAGSSESNSIKDIMSGPTDGMNFGYAHENSTEVPPSPASVCSSAHEEFCRPADHSSPISTLDVPLIEDCPVPQVFREISSNLHELRRQLNELECDYSQDMVIREESLEAKTVELEGPAEAYIRDLLFASGLYDGLCDGSSSRWDPIGRPIGNWVFKEVEGSYRRRDKEESSKAQYEREVGHKLLYDLTNEALSTIFGSSSRTWRLKNKIVGTSMFPPPCGSCGQILLDSVLEKIRGYSYRPMDDSCYSIDYMVARDLGMKPWLCMMDCDVEAISRELERTILYELIGETVRTMCVKSVAMGHE